MSPRKRKTEALVEAVLDDRPLPAGRIDDPEDLAALRAAIELRAAQPGADRPDMAFLADLGERVRSGRGPRVAPVSRRGFLAGAAAAVAAGAAGVVLDRTVLGSRSSTTGGHQVELAPDHGQWVAVAAEGDLGGGVAKPFTTGGVAGFVSEQAGVPVAVSGICTHLGCLLRINGSAGRLDCPCHATAFSYDGAVVSYELSSKPAPLPRIQARRTSGSIEVFVPPPV